MKKLTFIAAAAAAMVLASCGGKKAEADKTQNDTVSFEQSQIEQKIMVELDSIANIYTNLPAVEGVFANGKIALSDDEIKAKPTYLMDIKSIDDLSLLSQKYRAIGVLSVDAKIAELYKMDLDAYKAAIAKLATDINDPSIKYSEKFTAEDFKARYTTAKENGRVNFFWETATASVIEQLYVISQNTDKFLPAFDDKAASDLTYHIALLKLSLDDLGDYDKNIKSLAEILAPLNELNAVNVAQLKEQLAKAKPQIETARAQILK